MNKVILGLLVVSVSVFAKCDFSDGAVNSVADCPQVQCLPDATVVEDAPVCAVKPKPVVIKTIDCSCNPCAPKLEVIEVPCTVLLD